MNDQEKGILATFAGGLRVNGAEVRFSMSESPGSFPQLPHLRAALGGDPLVYAVGEAEMQALAKALVHVVGLALQNGETDDA